MMLDDDRAMHAAIARAKSRIAAEELREAVRRRAERNALVAKIALLLAVVAIGWLMFGRPAL